MKTTDIRIKSARFEYEDYHYRTPIKFGGVALDKAAIHSVVIVPQARVQSGNLLICEPGGVTEIDRRGVKTWSYNEEPRGFTSARKLANGNVMITSPNGRVLEVRPTGTSGGETSTVMEGLEYPLDAVPLDNGNLLVAEAGQPLEPRVDVPPLPSDWHGPPTRLPGSVGRCPAEREAVAFRVGTGVAAVMARRGVAAPSSPDAGGPPGRGPGGRRQW